MSKLLSRRHSTTVILIALLAGSTLLYYACFSSSQFGQGHDDGIYVTTAKALATGQGYRIISLPYEPAQTKYPPFYPFLLSLIWRLDPHFPQNLPWMMLLSTAATVAFLGLTYRYLVKHRYATRWQALLVVGLVAVNWRTVILATSVYSEMLYAALSVAVLHLAEKYEQPQRNLKGEAAVGIVAGLAFLTRTVGIVLPVAVCVHYAIKRQWRKSLVVAGVSSLFVIGWVAWGYWNRTPVDAVNVAYYTNYWRDISDVYAGMQEGTGLPKLIIIGIVIWKNILGLILISIPVLCLGISYEQVLYYGFVFLFVAAGFIRQVRSGLRLLHIYLIICLSINLPVPYTSYDRYLMPLLPFFLLFIITEAGALASVIRKQMSPAATVTNKVSAGFIGLALVAAVAIAVLNLGSELYARLASSSLRKSPGPAAEHAEVIQWINLNTSPTDVLVAYRDPLYYLYTGRKATQSVFLRYGNFLQSDESMIRERATLISRIIEENKASYLVINPNDFDLEFKSESQREAAREFIEQHPRNLVPAFTSSDGRSAVYRIEEHFTLNSRLTDR